MNYEDECSSKANCDTKPQICDKIPLVLVGKSKDIKV